MNFSQALEAMRAGKSVMRKGEGSNNTFPIIINFGKMYFCTQEAKEIHFHSITDIRVSDILADDWEVVE